MINLSKNIGAAIIVKNEENNIERCINSIKPFCKHIVVVDTGSIDKTPIIAAKLGADLYFCKWQNDFSTVRNYAIRHLYTEWIISIDADEELVQENFIPEFENITTIYKKENKKIGGISVVINNFLDENLMTSKKHRFTRIFKNNKKFQFEGKIHEQIADSINKSNYDIVESNIVFNHYGYIAQDIDKKQRNKILLEDAIKTDNNNDFLQYHLAATEFSIGNIDEAHNLYRNIVESQQLSNTQNEEVKIKLSQIFLIKNEFEKAIEILNFTSTNVDNEGLKLSILGIAYLSMQNFSKAKEIYNNPIICQSQLVDKTILDKAKEIFEIVEKK